MIDAIKTILSYVGIIIIGFVIFMLFIIFLVFPFSNNCYVGNKVYEYEDVNGNIGTAYHCQFSDASEYARKGGQGQPICFVDKKVISVKWYEDKTKYENCYKSLWE